MGDVAPWRPGVGACRLSGEILAKTTVGAGQGPRSRRRCRRPRAIRRARGSDAVTSLRRESRVQDDLNPRDSVCLRPSKPPAPCASVPGAGPSLKAPCSLERTTDGRPSACACGARNADGSPSAAVAHTESRPKKLVRVSGRAAYDGGSGTEQRCSKAGFQQVGHRLRPPQLARLWIATTCTRACPQARPKPNETWVARVDTTDARRSTEEGRPRQVRPTARA